ncbi:hypothetical protein OR60_08015 [Xanthomonas vesicatoria]|uniref:Uncharacterized protein n=1 Tax=Xanthomonas vesicatoria TaxID=56460 RepID=A0AAJ0IY15_9XANT|nr:hypothetical protein BI313_11740 [Xanthomonas vesicatoria]KHM94037.1 hypothetical protein OR61_12595 [Xanthomonas vesicatoria]KHM95566.1 hypothetical protein OR60_08015 [Xanthomonas vesicatoria]
MTAKIVDLAAPGATGDWWSGADLCDEHLIRDVDAMNTLIRRCAPPSPACRRREIGSRAMLLECRLRTLQTCIATPAQHDDTGPDRMSG